MQHDEVVAQDTAAALQGLDLTTTVNPSQGMPRAVSSDLDCAQAQDYDDWQAYDAAEQTGSTLFLLIPSCHDKEHGTYLCVMLAVKPK